ncbi:MAG: TetR/AcrR family transcriptional regulator [Acidimicrobiales bacterium]
MAPRNRSARALSNDTAIRNAAVELILRNGLDAISFREVGKAAGLSHGALYARFEDAEELLVDLWNEVLMHRIVILLEASKNAAAHPRDDLVAAALQRVRGAVPTDIVGVQVLLLSRRFPVLHEEVEVFINGYIEVKPVDLDDAKWSRTLVLFSLIMAKIFSNSEFGFNSERLDFMQQVLSSALTVDTDDVDQIE